MWRTFETAVIFLLLGRLENQISEKKITIRSTACSRRLAHQTEGILNAPRHSCGNKNDKEEEDCCSCCEIEQWNWAKVCEAVVWTPLPVRRYHNRTTTTEKLGKTLWRHWSNPVSHVPKLATVIWIQLVVLLPGKKMIAGKTNTTCVFWVISTC